MNWVNGEFLVRVTLRRSMWICVCVFSWIFLLFLSPLAAAPLQVSYGTAFAVSEDGYIVTSNHVVDRFEEVRLYSANSKQIFEARVVATDEINDLAILKVPNTKLIPLKFSDFNSIPTGLEILAFGFPQPKLQGGKLKISSGLINAREGFGGALGRFQFSAEIQRGHSGGPIIARDGSVVGLIQGKLAKTTTRDNEVIDLPQNVNFAVESSVILDFLQKNAVSVSHSMLSTRLERPTYVLFDEVSPSVFLVEVKRPSESVPNLSLGDLTDDTRKVLARLERPDQARLLGAINAGFKHLLDSKDEILLIEPQSSKTNTGAMTISFRSIVSFSAMKRHSRGFSYNSVIISSTYDCSLSTTLVDRLEYKEEKFGGGNTLLKLRRATRDDEGKTNSKKTIPDRLKSFFERHLC